MNPAAIRAVVFDAYGTLFDVHSVMALAETLVPGRGGDLSRLWRTKQLEYTWLRSLMGRYIDFWEVTRDGLAYANAALKLNLSPADLAQLLDAYLHLKPFPEVPAALKALAPRTRAILSNGSPGMLRAVVDNNHLHDDLTRLISVDELHVYKTDPRVYQLALDHLRLTREQILFVSSNNWDAQGAKAFGLSVAWINRGQAPQEFLGHSADFEIHTLSDLVGILHA